MGDLSEPDDMQSIRVSHIAIAPASYTVAVTLQFAEGQVTERQFSVRTPLDIEDGAAVAELTVLHHCLCEAHVFGVSRSGRGLRIVVSVGVIKKLFQQRSAKAHLLPYAQFLIVRFADANVRVEKPRLTEGDVPPEIQLEAGEGCLEHWSTCAGELVLTRHAIERYAQKVQRVSLDQSWHRLLNVLTHGRGTPLGADQRNGERWRFLKHNHPPLTIVVAREALANKVVTVYP